jgi:hypothetical protein
VIIIATDKGKEADQYTIYIYIYRRQAMSVMFEGRFWFFMHTATCRPH